MFNTGKVVPIHPFLFMDIHSLREKVVHPSMLFMDIYSLREIRVS